MTRRELADQLLAVALLIVGAAVQVWVVGR